MQMVMVIRIELKPSSFAKGFLYTIYMFVFSFPVIINFEIDTLNFNVQGQFSICYLDYKIMLLRDKFARSLYGTTRS